jgi:hypothetical protein
MSLIHIRNVIYLIFRYSLYIILYTLYLKAFKEFLDKIFLYKIINKKVVY